MKQAITRNSEGKKERGGTKGHIALGIGCRHQRDEDYLEKTIKERVDWGVPVSGLCSTKGNGHKYLISEMIIYSENNKLIQAKYLIKSLSWIIFSKLSVFLPPLIPTLQYSIC